MAELAPAVQAKLLRMLQERRFERVGGTREVYLDVRLVTATNRDLAAGMQRVRFRQDLYHRLAVFPLRLQRLRERPADILPLARHLLACIVRELNRPGLALAPAAQPLLVAHALPGNVR